MIYSRQMEASSQANARSFLNIQPDEDPIRYIVLRLCLEFSRASGFRSTTSREIVNMTLILRHASIFTFVFLPIPRVTCRSVRDRATDRPIGLLLVEYFQQQNPPSRLRVSFVG
jgi:hypothetical protein